MDRRGFVEVADAPKLRKQDRREWCTRRGRLIIDQLGTAVTVIAMAVAYAITAMTCRSAKTLA
jgi:hypothetical protein